MSKASLPIIKPIFDYNTNCFIPGGSVKAQIPTRNKRTGCTTEATGTATINT